MELLASLLAGLRAVCATFPDPRKGRSGNIAMADFGVAAFALFFMQSASFLSFQRTLTSYRPFSLVDPQPFVVGRQLPIDGAGSPRSASVRPLVCFAVPFCWSSQTETST